MPTNHSSKIIQARTLRANSTEAERILWAHLRAHRLNGIHFRRQFVIDRYIVDFCAPRKKLIIEVDGSPHLDQQNLDEERALFLKSKGYKILRFWNHEVTHHLDDVLEAILQATDMI